MSYEGYEEFICESGHYTVTDCNASFPAKCHCKKKMKWHHAVDVTNGYGENKKWEDPKTLKDSVKYYDQYAPKEVIGEEETEHKDHLGNRYFTKEELYAPSGNNVWAELTGS